MSHFHKTVNFTVAAPKTLHLKRIHMKGKAVPLQAWIGPEGSRKLRFPYFMTTAQDDGKVVSLTHRPPWPPGNAPGTDFCLRLSRPQGHNAIGRILCQWEIPMTPAGIEPGTFRFVAQHLNHCATAVPPKGYIYCCKFCPGSSNFYFYTSPCVVYVLCAKRWDAGTDQSSQNAFHHKFWNGNEAWCDTKFGKLLRCEEQIMATHSSCIVRCVTWSWHSPLNRKRFL